MNSYCRTCETTTCTDQAACQLACCWCDEIGTHQLVGPGCTSDLACAGHAVEWASSLTGVTANAL